MNSITPELSSPSGGDPSSSHPVEDTESQPISATQSTPGDKKANPKRFSNVLRRKRSNSSVNRSLQHSATPLLNSDGSHPWAWNFDRSLTIGDLDSPSPSLIERFVGGRRRRSSDSRPPSAFTSRQQPATPRVATGTEHVPNPLSKDPPPRPKILFYSKHEPYYGFTNFSSHPVKYEGKIYPTSEHLFQSLKFTHRPKLAEHIRTCSFRPSIAFSEARRFSLEVREDWNGDSIRAMETALSLKFKQHRSLRRELLSTGNAELIENSDKDAFWGCGPDGKGKNELGKALERLRDQLRKERGW